MAQTKMHRREVGDRVRMLHDDHHSLSENDEGPIVEISNDERTYVKVDFGDKGIQEVTEDEVVRVG